MVRSFSEETIRLAKTNSFQQVRNSNVAAVTMPVRLRGRRIWKNLPKKANGEDVVYTIVEENVKN